MKPCTGGAKPQPSLVGLPRYSAYSTCTCMYCTYVQPLYLQLTGHARSPCTSGVRWQIKISSRTIDSPRLPYLFAPRSGVQVNIKFAGVQNLSNQYRVHMHESVLDCHAAVKILHLHTVSRERIGRTSRSSEYKVEYSTRMKVIGWSVKAK